MVCPCVLKTWTPGTAAKDALKAAPEDEDAAEGDASGLALHDVEHEEGGRTESSELPAVHTPSAGPTSKSVCLGRRIGLAETASATTVSPSAEGLLEDAPDFRRPAQRGCPRSE